MEYERKSNWLNTRFFRILLVNAAVSLLLPSAAFAETLKVGGTGAALGAMLTSPTGAVEEADASYVALKPANMR